MVVVAQLVRASVCGTEGRGFESRLPPKSKSFSIMEELFLWKKLCNPKRPNRFPLFFEAFMRRRETG